MNFRIIARWGSPIRLSQTNDLADCCRPCKAAREHASALAGRLTILGEGQESMDSGADIVSVQAIDPESRVWQIVYQLPPLARAGN